MCAPEADHRSPSAPAGRAQCSLSTTQPGGHWCGVCLGGTALQEEDTEKGFWGRQPAGAHRPVDGAPGGRGSGLPAARAPPLAPVPLPPPGCRRGWDFSGRAGQLLRPVGFRRHADQRAAKGRRDLAGASHLCGCRPGQSEHPCMPTGWPRFCFPKGSTGCGSWGPPGPPWCGAVTAWLLGGGERGGGAGEQVLRGRHRGVWEVTGPPCWPEAAGSSEPRLWKPGLRASPLARTAPGPGAHSDQHLGGSVCTALPSPSRGRRSGLEVHWRRSAL